MQRVNYRDYVQDLAFRYGLRGYVENMPDNTVEIICEGPGEKISEFVKAIQEGVELSKGDGLGPFCKYADIKRVIVLEGDRQPLGKYVGFSIHYGTFQEELTQKFGVAQYALEGMDGKLDYMGVKLDSMDSKLDSMNGKLGSIDKKFDKIDKKFGVFREISQNTAESLEAINKTLAKMEMLLERDRRQTR